MCSAADALDGCAERVGRGIYFRTFVFPRSPPIIPGVRSALEP